MIRTMAAAIIFALAVPASAAAHRLDEYLQAARVLLDRDRLLVEIDLTPGASIAPDIIAAIDRDRDGAVSPAEARAYALDVLGEVTVTLDGRPIPVSLQRIESPSVDEMREGMGTVQLEAIGTVAITPGRHVVEFRNEHRAASSVYLVNALLSPDGAVTVLSQQRDQRQSRAEIEYDVARTGSPIVWGSLAGLTLAGLGVLRRPSGQPAQRSSRARAQQA